MNAKLVKKFSIFFLGMKHVLKQIQLELQKIGNAKLWVAQKLPKVSLPFASHALKL
jgi:hypothetical protein